MSFTPKVYKYGDTLTAEELNEILGRLVESAVIKPYTQEEFDNLDESEKTNSLVAVITDAEQDFSNEQILSPTTKELFGLSETATPDDAFKKLTGITLKNAYTKLWYKPSKQEHLNIDIGFNSTNGMGSIGNYGIIANSSSVTPELKIIDAALTINTVNSSIHKGNYKAKAKIGNYLLFAGGCDNSALNKVSVIDSSLMQSTPITLNTARANLAAAAVGDYVLFAGGRVNFSSDSAAGTSYATNSIEVFDSKLTRLTSITLSDYRSHLSGARAGNYAIFAGGTVRTYSNSAYRFSNKNTIDIYDSTLTKVTESLNLTTGAYAMGAGTARRNLYDDPSANEEIAFFIGGAINDQTANSVYRGSVSKITYCINSNSLSLSTLSGLTSAVANPIVVELDILLLIRGGHSISSTGATNNVMGVTTCYYPGSGQGIESQPTQVALTNEASLYNGQDALVVGDYILFLTMTGTLEVYINKSSYSLDITIPPWHTYSINNEPEVVTLNKSVDISRYELTNFNGYIRPTTKCYEGLIK